MRALDSWKATSACSSLCTSVPAWGGGGGGGGGRVLFYGVLTPHPLATPIGHTHQVCRHVLAAGPRLHQLSQHGWRDATPSARLHPRQLQRGQGGRLRRQHTVTRGNRARDQPPAILGHERALCHSAHQTSLTGLVELDGICGGGQGGRLLLLLLPVNVLSQQLLLLLNLLVLLLELLTQQIHLLADQGGLGG